MGIESEEKDMMNFKSRHRGIMSEVMNLFTELELLSRILETLKMRCHCNHRTKQRIGESKAGGDAETTGHYKSYGDKKAVP